MGKSRETIRARKHKELSSNDILKNSRLLRKLAMRGSQALDSPFSDKDAAIQISFLVRVDLRH